jgi:hypothetical protein
MDDHAHDRPPGKIRQEEQMTHDLRWRKPRQRVAVRDR